MVLHNNKWDRKKKYAYYKKHGLTPPPKSQALNTTEETVSEDSEDVKVEIDDNPQEQSQDQDETELVEAANNSLLPDLGFDDPEEQELIKKHIASLHGKVDRPRKAHVHYTSNASEFANVDAAIERQRIEVDLKRRFKSSRNTPAKELLRDDDDFEALMSNPLPKPSDLNITTNETLSSSIRASGESLHTQESDKFLDDLLR